MFSKKLNKVKKYYFSKHIQKVITSLVSEDALVINFDDSDVDSDNNKSDLEDANIEKDLCMYSDFTCS